MLMRHYETLDHRAAFRLQVGQLVAILQRGWVQIAEQEMLIVVRHLLFIVVQLRRKLFLHHSYTMLAMYSSQYCTSE